MSDYEKKVVRAIRLLKSIPTEEGPVEVYRCKEGVIWDKPDEPMKRKYGRNSI